ncbi:MAG TPA: branched-chain amino acid ABC transporter permease [Fimbriimonas sp.]|nr:branched-chain amino acid ABC transporter permease [Fimbriimonas sp.]
MKVDLKQWFGWRALSFLLVILGCFVVDRMLQGSDRSYIRFLVSLAGIYVTLAVSLNLINGITGMFSIGHAAFYQIGAYTTAFLASTQFQSLSGQGASPLQQGLWLVIASCIGAVVAGIAGFIVGLPSLRLRGDYLAVVTLGIGEIVSIVVKNQKSLGEAYGLSATKIESVFLVLMLAALSIAICRNLLKTSHGLTYLAVREDEIASSSMGVNVTAVKVTAFIIGSALAGAAGALYAHTKGFVAPQDFSMDTSFLILTMVVLGGTGSITGTSLAAIMLFIIPEKMRDLKNVTMGQPIGVAIGIIIGVVLLKRIQDTSHTEGWIRLRQNAIAMAIGAASAWIFAKLLPMIPLLKTEVNGGAFRMAALAVTLVVLMLLRPQGIFAHHEISLDMFRKLLSKRKGAEVKP